MKVEVRIGRVGLANGERMRVYGFPKETICVMLVGTRVDVATNPILREDESYCSIRNSDDGSAGGEARCGRR